MANFDNDAAGRIAAEEWARAKVAAGTWTNAHMAMSMAGNTICRFQRPASPSSATTKEYGGWTESRADDAT